MDYSATVIYNPFPILQSTFPKYFSSTKEITLNDFNKEFLDKCGVVDDTTTDVMTNDDFGKIFFPKDATEDNRQYITYNKNPIYDFKRMADNKITQINSLDVIKFSERGGTII